MGYVLCFNSLKLFFLGFRVILITLTDFNKMVETGMVLHLLFYLIAVSQSVSQSVNQLVSPLVRQSVRQSVSQTVR